MAGHWGVMNFRVSRRSDGWGGPQQLWFKTFSSVRAAPTNHPSKMLAVVPGETAGRRPAARIDLDKIKEALDVVPSAAMQPSNFFPYGHTIDFKRAPNWEKAAKYAASINMLLEASGGYNLVQLNMFNGFKKWAADSGQTYDVSALETAAY
eukprot:7150438-Pyramimonas_sp.AAC.1